MSRNSLTELSATLKQQIQEGYRQFLTMRGLKPRLGQKQMIAAIANALSAIETDGDGHRSIAQREQDLGICVVEAGTGTGKTMAYLLSALPLAQAFGKQLVIATGTVALQEQLIDKDIPAFLESTNWAYSFKVAKGRGRYLCPLRLDQCLNTVNARESGQFLFDDEVMFNTNQDVVKIYREMANALQEGHWDGDRDHWETVVSDNDWLPLTTDRRRCAGRHCRFIKTCCFFKARDELAEVDCLIVNHDLLMADLALGGGAILPSPEETIYVIDEAHRLADRAISHFAASCRLEGTLVGLQKMTRQIEFVIQQASGSVSLLEQLHRLEEPLTRVTEKLSQVQLYLSGMAEQQTEVKAQFRFSAGDVGEALRKLSAETANTFSLLQDRIQAVADELQAALSSLHPNIPLVDLENALQLVGIWQNRTENALQLWRYYGQPIANNSPPVARWLAFEDGDIHLYAAPTHSGDILRERLFDRCFGAVLTSATLRMLNSFREFLQRTGLRENCDSRVVAGAFDYQSAGVLDVPDIGADGGDPVAHTQAIIKVLPTMLDQPGGTLVLFSSKRQMEDVVQGISGRFSGQLLVQNDLPLPRLLARHKQKLDAGEASVIFGLASFAEGIDLPGDYCRRVIVAKLPFAVPDDPVAATFSEWLESTGGNAFMQLALPLASLRLSQACGRLLRTEQDTGTISILDRRILTKRYGATLLNTLPPFKRNFS